MTLFTIPFQVHDTLQTHMAEYLIVYSVSSDGGPAVPVEGGCM
jgi:hypothetical protein